MLVKFFKQYRNSVYHVMHLMNILITIVCVSLFNVDGE